MSDGLRLAHVEIADRERVLVSLDASVAPGEALTVMGPSGSGKSTLLGLVMGTLAPEFRARGTVSLDGRKLDGLASEDRRIGILYQDPLLFAHLDVAANLAFGLPRGGSRAARRATIDAALAQIDLAGFGPRDPATLSGGQAARVALMRVLLSEPRALLLDEPFSKLDTEMRGQMRDLVRDRIRAARIPAILVTHDVADAKAAGGTIVHLGQGGSTTRPALHPVGSAAIKVVRS